MATRSKTIGITNKDMYKHFRRPVIPFVIPNIQITNISNYVQDKVLSGILQNAQRKCYVASKPESHKNVQVQTDYRDSETQTEPWESPYKIVQGDNPEVLTLAHLTWKHGLPAGVHEVRVINRMRMKRAWETILPPMDTPANIKLRNSIITALEIDEWAFRESEIQFILDLRLRLMRKFLQSRELEHKKKMQDRFARLQQRLGKRRDEQVRTIQRNLKRDLRKLCTKQRDKQRPRKTDIIQRYADSETDLHVLQMHFGEHPRQASQEESVDKNGLKGEDTTLSRLPLIGESKLMRPKVDMCIRETRWTEEKLEQLHSDLKAIRMSVKSTDTIPTLMKRTFKQPAMPVTPRRSGVWDGKLKQREKAATFIQKLVRGKAIECLMYEGRERCGELIEELQSTQALEQEAEEEHLDSKERTIELQKLQDDQLMQEERLCEILNSLEGKTVCGSLNFLSKELVRLEDERKAHAFALLAERERCMREAAEAGRRQLERNRRREFDEMFRQIVKINQDSVESYLEDMIKEGIDWVSDKTAKEHVLELCDKMDVILKDASENADELAGKELVADMIHNFVLPEVEKRNIRRKIRDQQQSYMRDAHISIYEQILDLSSVEPSQVTVQEVCIKHEDMQAVSVNNVEQVANSEKVELATETESTEIVNSLLNSITADVIIENTTS